MLTPRIRLPYIEEQISVRLRPNIEANFAIAQRHGIGRPLPRLIPNDIIERQLFGDVGVRLLRLGGLETSGAHRNYRAYKRELPLCLGVNHDFALSPLSIPDPQHCNDMRKMSNGTDKHHHSDNSRHAYPLRKLRRFSIRFFRPAQSQVSQDKQRWATAAIRPRSFAPLVLRGVAVTTLPIAAGSRFAVIRNRLRTVVVLTQWDRLRRRAL